MLLTSIYKWYGGNGPSCVTTKFTLIVSLLIPTPVYPPIPPMLQHGPREILMRNGLTHSEEKLACSDNKEEMMMIPRDRLFQLFFFPGRTPRGRSSTVDAQTLYHHHLLSSVCIMGRHPNLTVAQIVCSRVLKCKSEKIAPKMFMYIVG